MNKWDDFWEVICYGASFGIALAIAILSIAGALGTVVWVVSHF